MNRAASFTAFFSLVISLNAFAANPYVFPKEGQGPEQQAADAGGCRAWAIRETGVDPAYVQGQMAMMSSQSRPQQSPVARQAVRGAATGAALGGIYNNMDPGAGRGATMGLTAGAMRGVAQRRDMQAQQQVDQANQQMAMLQASQDSYMRAFSACMDAKGYSVR